MTSPVFSLKRCGSNIAIPDELPICSRVPWPHQGLYGGPSCPCLPVSRPREQRMWLTGGLQGRGPLWDRGLLFCCVPFYSAWRASADLGSLAISMKKTTETELNKLHPDLTVGLMCLWNAWGLMLTPGRGREIHGPLRQGQLNVGHCAAPLVRVIC